MPLLPPKLFNNLCLTGEHTENLSEVWKISAPSKNSLYWSIILSYVISSGSSGMWQRGYELLLGSNLEIEDVMKKKKIAHKPDQNGIKNQVLRFNPFLHRSSIYFNPNLTDVHRIFKLRLKCFASGLKRRDEQWDNSLKLKAASIMLECRIVVITECSGAIEVEYHGKLPRRGGTQTVIFQQNDVQKGERKIDVFAFGMSLEHSIPKRRDALEHYLKMARVYSDDILQIKRNFGYDDNFLLFLITSEWKKIVPLIYKSPYISWKLADAGFNTDPCSVGRDGLSAFHHCMHLKSTRLLQIVYNYAVNNFQKSDEDLRKPNETILECLMKVGRSIKDDCSHSNDFSNLGDRKAAAIKTSREILYLNEYQSCLVKEICGILQSSYNNPVQRKNVVISVMDNYFKYSYYGTPTNGFRLFENHVQFSQYYENLDNFACLMFFDKVLSLNPSAITTDNFANTVVNLLLTILSYKFFPKCEHGIHCSECQITSDDCALRFISYNHRTKFQDFAKLYMAELQNDRVEYGADSKKMLNNVIGSLKDFPVITDEFLIKRLQRYLKTAIGVPLETDQLKGVLAIERALQVIGETLNASHKRKCSVGHLLQSCLPTDIVNKLFIIRNQYLSHFQPNIMHGTICLENDLKRFHSLQNLLNTLDDMLEPVYLSQEFRIEEYLITATERECRVFSESIYQKIIKNRKEIQLLKKEMYQKYKNKYKILSNNVLDYMQRLVDNNKYKKVYDLKVALESLNFLFTDIAEQCDINNSRKIVSYIQELEGLFDVGVDVDVQEDLKRIVIKNISNQRSVLLNIFEDVKTDKELKCSDLSELGRYFQDVKNTKWLTDDEVSVIRTEVLKHLRKSNAAKQGLKELFKTESPPILAEVKKLVSDIFTSVKNKELLITKSQSNPKNAQKILGTIKDVNENIVFSNMSEFTVFSIKEEGRDLLLDIKFADGLEEKVFRYLNRNLQCLMNRIEHLKEILIDEDDEISILWKWGRSAEIKRHTRFLMGQRYMKEKDVRSSLEMLLFNCMNILVGRKDLEQLWTKATNLFTGINLRNVLSHGTTVLELVGGLLDPEDLPTQFIDKMLELIEDGESLQALSELWKTTKPIDLQQLKGALASPAPNKMSLVGKVQKCDKWEAYLQFLPYN